MLALFHFLFKLFFRQRGIFLRDRSFSHCQNRKAFSGSGSCLNGFDYFINIIGNLRNQDNIRAAGNSRMEREPAHLMSHDLYDKYPAMGRGGCMDTVDGVRRNVYRALEAKGHIRSPKIVVDRLGESDHIQALLA